MSERIASAACRIGRAVVASLPPPARHHNIMRELDQVRKGLGLVHPEDQGFLTSSGRFLDRNAAWGIAENAGQIIGKPPCPGTLYSEDLW